MRKTNADITNKEVEMIISGRLTEFNNTLKAIDGLYMKRDGVGGLMMSTEINNMYAELGDLGEKLDDIKKLSDVQWANYNFKIINEKYLGDKENA